MTMTMLALVLGAGGGEVLDEARALRRAGSLDEAVTLLEDALRTDESAATLGGGEAAAQFDLSAGHDAEELAGLLGLCLLDKGRAARAGELALSLADYDGNSSIRKLLPS